jgi:hypothetical protein
MKTDRAIYAVLIVFGLYLAVRYSVVIPVWVAR